MIGLASYADKAAGAVEKAEASLARHRADREAHLAAKPDGSDLDALIAWKRLAADFDLRVEAGEEALEFARVSAAQQAARAVEAEADRRHATAKRLAKAGEKLTLEAATLAEKLADALAALEANRAEVEATNAVRGSRPYIVDGEAKLRGTPALEIPAVTRREKAWVDANGNRPSQLVERNGEMVPAGLSGDFTLRTVEVVETAARIEPARMPERLATAIRLVGLKGEGLWPR